MPRKKFLFTKEGLENLIKEKQVLEERRIGAVNELTVARDMGDRSENAAYKYGRQKLSGIDRQLRYINSRLQYAIIVEPRTDGKVGIGSKVTISNEKGEKEYLVVGGDESDVLNGKISQFSPLGRALMGRKVGDTTQLLVPVGKVSYIVLKVV